MEYRLHWIPWHWGSHWACTFHVFCVDSFALGSQCEACFQWNMGFSLIITSRVYPPFLSVLPLGLPSVLAASLPFSAWSSFMALALRLMGLSEGALGREGSDGFSCGGPGVWSSMTCAQMFNNLGRQKKVNIMERLTWCFYRLSSAFKVHWSSTSNPRTIKPQMCRGLYYPPEVRRGKYWGLGVFLLQYLPLVKI